MEKSPVQQQIAGLTILEEPTRRALYFHVIESGRETSRDQAAQALGVSRNLAGFHLDRLAEEGFLDVSYRRLSGRSGPGAGRPAKLYRRSQRQVQVSLPQRDYELAAKILAAAVDASHSRELNDTLHATARAAGLRMGREARAETASRPAAATPIDAVMAALRAHGYEPLQEQGEVRLRNCPFHSLADQNTALVCGMNLSMIGGLVEGIGLTGFRPVLEPHAARCCVCLKAEQCQQDAASD